MSILSWKSEFYPIPASRCKTWLQAAKHSLRKWEGLRKENLKQHQLVRSGLHLYPSDHQDRIVFTVLGDSCALCHRARTQNCSQCPITKLGSRACDESGSAFDIFRHARDYTTWTESTSPEPMIKLLTKVVKSLQRKPVRTKPRKGKS